ncbi:hypothetical protein FD744_21410 [Pantoea sp. Taur]|nr:hypothetical protein [Pantoea sp. Taur]
MCNLCNTPHPAEETRRCLSEITDKLRGVRCNYRGIRFKLRCTEIQESDNRILLAATKGFAH